MVRIYCPTCNGQLELADNLQEAVCIHCGRRVIVPQGYSREQSSLLFATEARLRRDYSTAEKSYEQTIRDYPDSAAAHWGLALTRYEIGYQPIGDNKYRLLCDQAERGGFSDDGDVRSALELSEGKEREQYREEAARIDALLAKVKEYSSLHEGCDAIVDAGASDLVGRQRAEEIAVMLRAAGVRTFCIPTECGNMPREDWEPALYRAFSTAGVMILSAGAADAFDEDLIFDAQRMLHRKADAQRKASRRIPKLFLLFSHLDEYEDIPDELFDGIDTRFPDADEASSDDLREAVVGTIEDHQRALKTESRNADDQAYSNRLAQARLALERGEFSRAEQMYDTILNENARESQAHWGLLLAEMRCRDEDSLIEQGALLQGKVNFINACVYANEREKQIYESIGAKAAERYELLERQRKQKEKESREYQEEQERKQQEIEIAKRRKEEAEHAAKRKALRYGLILLAVLVVGGIGGLIYYKHYQATTLVLEQAYDEATVQYQQGDYEAAAAAFADLAEKGFKDSEDMYAQTMEIWDLQVYNGQVQAYNDALQYGADLNQRAKAVNTVESLAGIVPGAQETLDAWYAEGMSFFENDMCGEAYLALNAFNSEDPEFLRVIRLCTPMYDSRAALANNYAMAAISSETGTVISVNCDTLNFEEGEAISVDLSSSGDSAAVVRADGTVYLAGVVAGYADVSGWSNVHMVQVTDQTVFGLTNDHTLLRTNGGSLDNIRHFAINSNEELIACRMDGTVYTESAYADADLSDWTDVAAVGILDGTSLKVYGLRGDGTMYSHNAKDVSLYTDVISIATGGDRMSTFGKDNTQGWTVSAALCSNAEVDIYERSASLSNMSTEQPVVNLRIFVRDQLP